MRDFTSKTYKFSISVCTVVMAFLAFISILATYAMMITSPYVEGDYSNGESAYFPAVICLVLLALIAMKVTKDLTSFHGEYSYYYTKMESMRRVVVKWGSMVGLPIVTLPQLALMITSDPMTQSYKNDIMNSMGYGTFVILILLSMYIIYIGAAIKANTESCAIRYQAALEEDEEDYIDETVKKIYSNSATKDVKVKIEKDEYANEKSNYSKIKVKSSKYSLSSTYSFYWIPLVPVGIMSWGLIMTVVSGVGIQDMYQHNYVRPISTIISLSIPCLMMIALDRKTRAYYSKKSAYYQSIGRLKKWTYNYLTKITFFVVLPLCFIIAPTDSIYSLSMTEALILFVSDLYLFAHALLIFRYFYVSKKLEIALLEQNQKDRIKKKQQQKEESEE